MNFSSYACGSLLIFAVLINIIYDKSVRISFIYQIFYYRD